MENFKLHHGNCIDVMRSMPDNYVDSIVTDPPYELGFMGKTWDASGVAYNVEMWREALRVLKPGGHLLAFSGSRTYHRMACAIEDGGFEIRDQIMWVYGSGFPKSLDVSKAIDKARTEDVEPTRVICRAIRAAMDARGLKSKDLSPSFGGCHPRLIDHWAARDTDSQPSLPTWEQWEKLRDLLDMGAAHDTEVWRLNGRKGQPGDIYQNAEIVGHHEGVTPGFGEHRFKVADTAIRELSAAARQWEGWGTALKPAFEPLCVAQKPLPENMELDTITANLFKLEARLWLLSLANAAEKNSTLSQNELSEAFAIAQWTADGLTSTQEDLCEVMGMSQYELVINTCLSIVTSWRNTLGAICKLGNTSTTETNSSTTTDWKILNFCLSQITPRTITTGLSIQHGLIAHAFNAERYFDAELKKLNATLELSALAPAISQDRQNCLDVDGKVKHEPICVARKPLASLPANVLQVVESQLRERGARGEIMWKPEPVSGAAKASSRKNSSSTSRPAKPAEVSAKNAGESVIVNVVQETRSDSEQHGENGQPKTRDASGSSLGSMIEDYAIKSLPHMAVCAPVAESRTETFSPSTTSTEEEQSTGKNSAEKSTHNCDEKASQPDTESFAGIATGLTGSMAHVLINRDASGFYLWPQGLPKYVPGSPLTVAANVLAHGTGALNIDGCRVPSEKATGWGGGSALYDGGLSREGGEARLQDSGRWPANLIHDGSDEVLAAFPDAKGQQGDLKETGRPRPSSGRFGNMAPPHAHAARFETETSAARFFYCAKASKSDRGPGNTHPTVKPTDLMAYLVRLVTPPGGVVLDPFMGSGSTGKAAMREGMQFIGIDMTEEYITIATERIMDEAGKVKVEETPAPQMNLFA